MILILQYDAFESLWCSFGCFGSSTFQKTFFWNFFTQFQLQWVSNWIPFVECKASVICFGSLQFAAFKGKRFPQCCRFSSSALTSSNNLILWSLSISQSFLSLPSRLEDSCADRIFGGMGRRGLEVKSGVISFIGYFCISAIQFCLHNQTAWNWLNCAKWLVHCHIWWHPRVSWTQLEEWCLCWWHGLVELGLLSLWGCWGLGKMWWQLWWQYGSPLMHKGWLGIVLPLPAVGMMCASTRSELH